MAVCLKYTLCTFTTVVLLGGSVMLGLGIWVTTQDTEYKHLAGNQNVTIGYIVLSSFVFITGFIGSCGIILMKDNLLRAYFAFMLILLLAELGVAIYLYVEKDQIQDHIATNWDETTDEVRILIQEKFECCGLSPINLNHKSSSDKSCFVDDNPRNKRLKDCYTNLMDWIKRNHVILATCSVIVAVLQMLILGGTCRLIAAIESGDRTVRRTRVVPINVQPIAVAPIQVQNVYPDYWSPSYLNPGYLNPGQGNSGPTPQPAKAEPEEVTQNDSATPLSEDSEDGPIRSNIKRKEWAKINPKYNPVFSLLDLKL